MPTHAPGAPPPPGWRAALTEAELLLGLAEAGGTLKTVPHGAAARQVLARRHPNPNPNPNPKPNPNPNPNPYPYPYP